MSDEGGLSREAESVLRVLFRYRARAAAGDELMERLFATTSELPLDPEAVSRAVRELVGRGFATIDADGKPDPGFDFAVVAITDAGRGHITT